MPLSWNDIKSRALAFSQTWATASNEDSEAKPFLIDFFEVFGIGNSPFIGKNYLNNQQDADMASVFTQAFIHPIMITPQ